MNLLNGVQNLDSSTSGKKFLEVRTLAQKRVSEMPWPNRHQENWKYTNLDFLKNTEWQTANASAKTDKALSSNYSQQVEDMFDTLTFINGVFQKPSAKSISVRNFTELSVAEITEVFKNQSTGEIFESLNSAWSEEGLLIEIPEGKSLEKPICLDFYYSAATALAAHPRVVINMGKASQAKVIFRNFGTGTYFNNLVAKINLDEASQMEFVNYQYNSDTSHSFSNLQFRLQKSAKLKTLNVSLAGKLNRENLEILHLGEESLSHCNGVYLTQGKNQSDHYTNIEHRVGHCQSHQLYKGLLADESRAVFNGRVFINHGAMKADSAQLNNNLLLSSKAEIDSKPQLEILADDVKATHGSTVGQLDEEEIFYLQSRGIDRNKSIQLLAHGYAFEVINQLEDAKLSSWLKSQLLNSLQKLEFA